MSSPLDNNAQHIMRGEFENILKQIDSRLDIIQDSVSNNSTWQQNHDRDDTRRFEETVELLREQTDELTLKIENVKASVEPLLADHQEKLRKDQNSAENKRLFKSTLLERLVTIIITIAATVGGAWFLKDLK